MIDKARREPPHLYLEASNATDTEQAVNESPGRLIRQARERVQMSLDELAAQTKLSHSVLDALERDDFKVLREPVYVRGYYRRCCKSLTLSEETLIAAYKRLIGSASLAPPSKLLLVPENEVFGSKGRGSMRWWVALLVVLAVLVAVYWYLRNRTNSPAVPPVPVKLSPTTRGPNAEPPVVDHAAVAANAPAIAVKAAPTSAASTAAMVPAGVPAEQPASQTEQPASQTESSPVAGSSSAPEPPPVTAAQSSLILNFNKTSWVRIEDSTGKVLLTGVIQAGDEKVLTGKPPYSVFLGNAPGVTVEYGGKAVDTQHFIRSNSTARFSVPLG